MRCSVTELGRSVTACPRKEPNLFSKRCMSRAREVLPIAAVSEALAASPACGDVNVTLFMHVKLVQRETTTKTKTKTRTKSSPSSTTTEIIIQKKASSESKGYIICLFSRQSFDKTESASSQ